MRAGFARGSKIKTPGISNNEQAMFGQLPPRRDAPAGRLYLLSLRVSIRARFS
jgi:hypothetical protein